MGFRYRKSINLGGGFKVNISKSGVGYSWGTKGYRVTKTADGKVKQTVSIPGTGISHVSQLNNNSSKKNHPSSSNTDDSHKIESADLNQLSDDNYKVLTNNIKRVITINSYANILLIVCFIVSLFSGLYPLLLIPLAWKIYIRMTMKIDIEYELNEYSQERINKISELINILKQNNAIWQITSFTNTQNKKTNAGASRNLQLHKTSFLERTPFYLKINCPCFFIKLQKESVFILPDKLLIIKGTDVATINIDSLDINVCESRFIERNTPKDASVIDKTWQYVNKNGAPDKRYKNNKKLDVCLYGRISFKSKDGLNVLLQFSNVNTCREFKKNI